MTETTNTTSNYPYVVREHLDEAPASMDALDLLDALTEARAQVVSDSPFAGRFATLDEATRYAEAVRALGVPATVISES